MRKHKNRKFIRKSCFTLFELLISVGLLVVLSVVLLRTLVLTSDYWIKTDEQAQLQADAKMPTANIEINNLFIVL